MAKSRRNILQDLILANTHENNNTMKYYNLHEFYQRFRKPGCVSRGTFNTRMLQRLLESNTGIMTVPLASGGSHMFIEAGGETEKEIINLLTK